MSDRQFCFHLLPTNLFAYKDIKNQTTNTIHASDDELTSPIEVEDIEDATAKKLQIMQNLLSRAVLNMFNDS